MAYHGLMTTIKPSDFGFADNGEAWRAFGAAEGLINFLEERSASLRDWVAYGRFAEELSPAEHALPELSAIHPIQSYLDLAAVDAYERGESLGGAAKRWYEIHPTLFIVNGTTFIFQGTHRLAALSKRGSTTFTGWVLNLDDPSVHDL